MVAFDQGLPIRRELDKALGARGVEVVNVAEFDNIETIKRAIEAGTGFGLLPAPTVVREVDSGALIAIPLAGDSLVRPLGIICRRGKKLGKTARRFIELLRESRDARRDQNENRTLTAAS
jgi:DNA-binding transcriptional LysR family regulator